MYYCIMNNINTKINLKEIEKQTYRFTFQDGLYDITYGTILISFAIAPILREIIYLWYIAFLILPAPLILLLGKRFITIPRIGIVKFKQERNESKKKIKLLISILFPITIITVALTIISIFNITISGFIVPVGAGIFALVLLSSIAYLIDYPHFYIYAISIGLGIPLTEILEPLIGEPLDALVSFGISGILILLYGVLTLHKFMQTYPIPDKKMDHANE